jgi:hypothetical protein
MERPVDAGRSGSARRRPLLGDASKGDRDVYSTLRQVFAIRSLKPVAFFLFVHNATVTTRPLPALAEPTQGRGFRRALRLGRNNRVSAELLKQGVNAVELILRNAGSEERAVAASGAGSQGPVRCRHAAEGRFGVPSQGAPGCRLRSASRRQTEERADEGNTKVRIRKQVRPMFLDHSLVCRTMNCAVERAGEASESEDDQSQSLIPRRGQRAEGPRFRAFVPGTSWRGKDAEGREKNAWSVNPARAADRRPRDNTGPRLTKAYLVAAPMRDA